ncbi:MAG: RHS repeat-associated core domain-containing protein [Bacteroidota bacterium]
MDLADPASGEVTQVNNYYPFGMVHPENCAPDGVVGNDNQFRFNGIEHLDKVGIDLAPFRGYDPAIGRWLHIDPIFRFHESGYASMANNPIGLSDPLGLAPGGEEKDPEKKKLKETVLFDSGKQWSLDDPVVVTPSEEPNTRVYLDVENPIPYVDLGKRREEVDGWLGIPHARPHYSETPETRDFLVQASEFILEAKLFLGVPIRIAKDITSSASYLEALRTFTYRNPAFLNRYVPGIWDINVPLGQMTKGFLVFGIAADGVYTAVDPNLSYVSASKWGARTIVSVLATKNPYAFGGAVTVGLYNRYVYSQPDVRAAVEGWSSTSGGPVAYWTVKGLNLASWLFY